MKHILFVLLLFLGAPAFTQTVFTAGLTYTNGAPTHNPGSNGSRYAIDTVTFNLYIRSYGTTWTLIGQNWPQSISGCSAPAYTPTKHQSKVVINACTPAEMYIWDGSNWGLVNAPAGITGTGLANRVPVWTDAGNLSYESTFRMDTVNNRLILGSQTVTPARTLHVEGEARISDLTTDTPTRLVGADADGDLGDAGSGAATRVTIWDGPGQVGSADSVVVTESPADRLGLGILSPTGRLHIQGAGTTSATWGVQVHNSATNNALMIRDDGRIGIGTNAPLRTLHVKKIPSGSEPIAFFERTDASTPAWVRIGQNVSVGTEFALEFGLSGGTSQFFTGTTSGDGAIKLNGATNKLFIGATTGSNASFVLAQDRLVGMGITTPQAVLHIKGVGTTSALTSPFYITNSIDSSIFLVKNDRRVGINTTTPDVSLDMGDCTDGIKMPSGTTAQRPSINNSIRYNSDVEGFEARENSVWFRLTSSQAPSIAAGAAAGTTPTVAIGAGSNDLGGTIEITTGTSPTTGTLATITYGDAFDASLSPHVTITPANDKAAEHMLQWYKGTSGNTSFVLTSRVALDASTAYVFTYQVQQ